MQNRATWEKDGKRITGTWSYYRPGDVFTVSLDTLDPVTGRRREFLVHGDHPNFNGWKLVKE